MILDTGKIRELVNWRMRFSSLSAISVVNEKTNPMPAYGRKLEVLNPKSETRIEPVCICKTKPISARPAISAVNEKTNPIFCTTLHAELVKEKEGYM